MRTSFLAVFVCLFATAAFADDNKPPAISGVKAQVKGGKVTVEAMITDETGVLSAVIHHRGKGGQVEDTPLTKADYEDKFTATFAGGGDTEYWIDATDLLGNGPSTYGTMGHPMALGGKPSKEVASKEPEPKAEPKRTEPKRAPEPKAEPEEKRASTGGGRKHGGGAKTAAASGPEIEHRAPTAQLPEGREFTLRAKIKNATVGVMTARPQGGSFSSVVMKNSEGESWEAVLPATLAKGTVEYFLIAKSSSGAQKKVGADGSDATPYVIHFKAAASASVASASAAKSSGPYDFAHYPLYRVEPNRPIVVRAQIVPTSDSGDMPDKVEVLFRGNDAQDQVAEMTRDENGGYGGYKAELPAQGEGAVFYAIVACGAGDTKCGIDTGSKRKWHAAAVASQPGSAMPLPLDSPSAKAPASLPE